MNLASAYHKLLFSPRQLAHCRAAKQKQTLFNESEKKRIHETLFPVYEALVRKSNTVAERTRYAG